MEPRERQQRSGVVDKANSLINTTKNIQRTIKIGRLIGTTASISELWIPIVIVVVVIILLTFFILMSTTGTATTLEEAGTTNITPGGGGENVSVNPLPPNAPLFIPPSTDTCGGYYDPSLNPTKKNFGDPQCELTNASSLDLLYKYLQELDPTNADIWYYIIIPRESGYNPNSFSGNSASGNGAYGLFQMNPSSQGNSQYDAGNVSWRQQVYNAIMYNNALILLGKDFDYWATRPCQFVDPDDADFPGGLNTCSR